MSLNFRWYVVELNQLADTLYLYNVFLIKKRFIKIVFFSPVDLSLCLQSAVPLVFKNRNNHFNFWCYFPVGNLKPCNICGQN